MNIPVDTKLMILLLGIGYLFTLILIIAYEYKHKKNDLTNTFFIAKAIQTIAWFFMLLRGGDYDFLSISVANSLLFIGYSLETMALLQLKQALPPKIKTIYLVATLLSIFGFQLICIFYNKENIRIAYFSFVTAAIFIPVYRIIFGKALTLLMRIIGSIYLFVSAASLVRGIIALIPSSFSTSLFTPGIFQLMTFLNP